MSEQAFFLYDLHLRTSPRQGMDDLVRKAADAGFRSFGVVGDVAPWGIKNDEELRRFIDEVKDYPCLMGLRPAEPGWSANLSAELVGQVDYVLMAPQYMPDGNRYGDRMEVWDHNCYVDDPEDFMRRHMAWYRRILENDEPLDILSWPLFLPLSLQREYDALWTRERQETLIEAARRRGVAIEINDLAHTPHAEFILMARQAGLKFTFGSDTRDHRTFRLDYCKRVASLCGLTEADLFLPGRKPRG